MPSGAQGSRHGAGQVDRRRRHDFGVSLGVHHCAECHKVVWNRGCACCGDRLCAAHFAGHRCKHAGSACSSSAPTPGAEEPPLVDAAALARDCGHLALSGRYHGPERALEEDVMVDHEVLGTGVSGLVKAGRHRRDGRRCAVKSFSKRGLREAQLTSLKNEAEVFLSVDHPHIAKLDAVYETGDSLHLVMEHLEGGEIYDRLAKCRRFGEPLAAETLRQALSAVSYLHAQRLVHLDLKVENFIYERGDLRHVKLIDFGFAERLPPGRRLRKPCGSLHSVAPEVLARDYDEKADVWSMGVLAYILLTGTSPWKGADSQVMDSIRQGRPNYSRPQFLELSPGARDFVKSLLTFDAAARPSAEQALSHPWLDLAAAASSPSPNAAALAQRYLRARRLPVGLTSEARSLFLKTCDARGVISLDGFVRLMKPPGVSRQDAEQMFGALDLMRRREVCFSDFLAAVVPHLDHHEEDQPPLMPRLDLSESLPGAVEEQAQAASAPEPIGSSPRSPRGASKPCCEDDAASTVAGPVRDSLLTLSSAISSEDVPEAAELALTPVADKLCCTRRRAAKGAPRSAASAAEGGPLEPLMSVLRML